MPSRVRRCGPQRVTSTPAKRTRPDVGRKVPEIRWKSVDFPAPFGPITAWREPASTASVTSSTARSSPYLRPTACSSSTLIRSGAGEPAPPLPVRVRVANLCLSHRAPPTKPNGSR